MTNPQSDIDRYLISSDITILKTVNGSISDIISYHISIAERERERERISADIRYQPISVLAGGT